jgi:putative Mg2+ transporter-C (MgtC) family protein
MLTLEPGSELALLVRILAAGVFAAVVGWEREAAHQSAGLRTHIVVGMASCLYTVLGGLAIQDYPVEEDRMQVDPIRAIQAIAIGIGFLGSGIIFVSRGRNRVFGLTTAASVWATAAVGIAAGLGHYVLALGTTLLLLLVLRAMYRRSDDS